MFNNNIFDTKFFINTLNIIQYRLGQQKKDLSISIDYFYRLLKNVIKH